MNVPGGQGVSVPEGQGVSVPEGQGVSASAQESAQESVQESVRESVRESVLALDGVRSGYGEAAVVRGVSLRVPPSSVVALLGANGAGKTTLLKTIAGFVPATSGEITMAGESLRGLRPHQRQRKGLCYIPEGRGIFRSLSVRENLALQGPARETRNTVEKALEAFPALAPRLSQTAGTLSGGEQQMLALAQAYVALPRVILVDEASLGLAPKIVDAIFEFLESVNRRGTAVLLVDQFVGRALDLSCYAYVLRRGEIVRAGGAAELRGTDIIDQYLGEGVRGRADGSVAGDG